MQNSVMVQIQTAQNNCLCDPQKIVLTSIVTLCPLIVFIKHFTLDIDEIVYIDRCHNKKNTLHVNHFLRSVTACTCLCTMQNMIYDPNCNEITFQVQAHCMHQTEFHRNCLNYVSQEFRHDALISLPCTLQVNPLSIAKFPLGILACNPRG